MHLEKILPCWKDNWYQSRDLIVSSFVIFFHNIQEAQSFSRESESTRLLCAWLYVTFSMFDTFQLQIRQLLGCLIGNFVGSIIVFCQLSNFVEAECFCIRENRKVNLFEWSSLFDVVGWWTQVGQELEVKKFPNISFYDRAIFHLKCLKY